jgi:hypothetical protein
MIFSEILLTTPPSGCIVTIFIDQFGHPYTPGPATFQNTPICPGTPSSFQLYGWIKKITLHEIR